MVIKDFILTHTNWEELLTSDPFNLTVTRDNGYVIFKYNQIASDFQNPIVREARGSIFRESDWECVCHPFDKFGNYGESYCPDIDWDSASVQEKIDGSLIKFWYDNEWHISTNGTINAFNAELNTTKYKNFGELVLDAIRNVFNDEHDFFSKLNNNYTYMFEIVSPYNRVVIPYHDTQLYLLGMRDENDNEQMVDNSELSKYFKIPKRYNLHSLDDVQKAASILPWDEEGYVVCDKYFNRVKIKSPKYVTAHYARNNSSINTERLVEIILSGEQEEFLIYASDFKDDLESVESIMQEIAQSAVNTMHEVYGDKEYNTRGEYARSIIDNPNYMKDFLFHCFDEKIFYDYAKSWTSKFWAKVIEEYKGTYGTRY